MRNFLICFLLVQQVFAQTTTQSLEQDLQGELADSTRVQKLLALSQAYQTTDIGRAREIAEQAINIAEEKDLGIQKSHAYQHMGDLYTISGDFINALKYDNQALQISLALNDSLEMSRNYSGIANDFYDLGEYDDAYANFTQSYKIGQLIDNDLRVAIATHNIGRVFKELGQYEEARIYLRRSQLISEQIGDADGLPYSQNEIGDVQLRQGKYDSALQTLMNSLRHTRRQKITELEPRTLSLIGTIYLRKKDFGRALAYYDSAWNHHQKTNNQLGRGEVLLGRATILKEQGKYDDAISRANESIAVAQQLNAKKLQIACFNLLASVLELKGDHRQALAYYKQHKTLEDSLFGNHMEEKLLRDQVRFETEAKDSQIAALRSSQQQKDDQLKKQEFVRNILVVVMALSVILLATVYRSGQRRRQINALLLKHQEETEKRSEELERLNQVKDKFFSIISHDLRSPINALSGLLDLLDKGAVKPEELPKHLHELKTRFNHTRTLLNNLLDWTLLQMDKLNLQATKIDLQKLVDENIELLKSLQNKQVSIVNKVPSHAVAYADPNTTNLVIRNLLTNALKFTNDGGEVVIGAAEKGGHWTITVKDNGVGITPDVMRILFDKTAPYTTRGTANEKGTGLGLILCKEFVEKNGGEIWVNSEEGKGSVFAFTIPKAQ